MNAPHPPAGPDAPDKPRQPLAEPDPDAPGLHYVALVGGQTQQVLLAIMDAVDRGCRIARLTLVCSERSSKEAGAIEQALKEMPELPVASVDQRIVDPYNHGTVQAAIEEDLHEKDPQHLARIDLTGGTKMMAIGAFQAAELYGHEWSYLAMENNGFVESTGTRPLSARVVAALSIQAVIKGNQQTATIHTPDYQYAEQAEQLLAVTLMEHPNARRLFNVALNGASIRLKTRWTPPSLNLLEKWHWVSLREANGGLDVTRTKKCPWKRAGDWLETYVADQVRQIDGVRELCVSAEGGLIRGGSAVASNEHDVMFLYNGRLVTLECKAGEFPKETFEERNALRAVWGGRYGRTGIITTEFVGRDRDQPNSLFSRAETRGMFTAGRDELGDLQNRLKRFLDRSMVQL